MPTGMAANADAGTCAETVEPREGTAAVSKKRKMAIRVDYAAGSRSGVAVTESTPHTAPEDHPATAALAESGTAAEPDNEFLQERAQMQALLDFPVLHPVTASLLSPSPDPAPFATYDPYAWIVQPRSPNRIHCPSRSFPCASGAICDCVISFSRYGMSVSGRGLPGSDFHRAGKRFHRANVRRQ